MCKLSTVVPVYNVEKYIRRCLESLLKQGMRDGEHEILLIDDGSTDNSGIICDEYSKRYPSLIRTIHQVNAGVSAARNVGMYESSGDYIHFMDADDEMVYGSYRILLDIDSDVDYISFVHNSIDTTDGTTSCFDATDNNEVFDNIVELQGIDLIKKRQIWTSAWCYIVKRTFLLKNNLSFNEHMIAGEDALFSFQGIAKNPKILMTFVPMYNYYTRLGSAMTCLSKDRYEKWMASIILHLEGLKRLGHDNDEISEYMKEWIDRMVGWYFTKILRFEMSYKDCVNICNEFGALGVLPTSGYSMIMRAADFFLMHPKALFCGATVYRKVLYRFVYPLIRKKVRARCG